MLCQNCNQRVAVIHITKIMNGEKQEVHLCDQCSTLNGVYNSSFDFQSFISNLLDIEGYPANAGYSENTSYRCSQCGMDFETFKHHGKFGCEKCYETFGSLIHSMIKRMHGKDQHKGKIVKYGGEDIKLRRELADLDASLANAIEKEEYEQAAIFRDKIILIKEQMKNDMMS